METTNKQMVEELRRNGVDVPTNKENDNEWLDWALIDLDNSKLAAY